MCALQRIGREVMVVLDHHGIVAAATAVSFQVAVCMAWLQMGSRACDLQSQRGVKTAQPLHPSIKQSRVRVDF